MKVLTKTLTASALTTALLASTSLFANTTANVQVQTSQPSVLQNLKHDVKHAAHATGETVEHGIDKTKAFSKEKWQDTKDAVIGTNDGNIPIERAELSQPSSN